MDQRDRRYIEFGEWSEGPPGYDDVVPPIVQLDVEGYGVVLATKANQNGGRCNCCPDFDMMRIKRWRPARLAEMECHIETDDEEETTE